MPQVSTSPLSGPEGRALHAANDCGETLYWRIGVAYLASEITSGLPVSHSWSTPGRMAAFESQNRAIPLKTAVFACARASQYGVTI